MAIMSQQMSPEMLTAMLSDPRAQPAQRMAAMNMLNQMQGGGGSPMAAPMAAPQGDGTGAGDMDPSFIRAVQREMQGEQAPQGLPPVRGVQSDIAAGVEAASGFAQGGAVRGYQVGGDVLRVGRERFINAPGINFDPPQRQMGQNPMFPQLTTPDVIFGNLGPSVLGRPQVDSEDEDSKYGVMFEDAGKKYLESSADETTPEDDRNSALLKFGLGMMTSASKPGATFLGAAGEGGLNAVSEFEKARASRAENRMKKLGLIGNLAEREAARNDKKEQNEINEQAAKEKFEELKRSNLKGEELESRQQDIMRELGLSKDATNRILAEIASDRAKTAKEEVERKRIELTPTEKRIADKSATEAQSYSTKVDFADLLLQKLEPTNGTPGILDNASSGFGATVGQTVRGAVGSPSEVDDFRKEIGKISISDVQRLLPPGSASDADMNLVTRYMANPTGDKASIKRVLEAYRRLNATAAQYQGFKGEYVTNSRQSDHKDFEIYGVPMPAGITETKAFELFKKSLLPPAAKEDESRSQSKPVSTNRKPIGTFYKPGANGRGE